MSEPSWDVFISHAHEDKGADAKPLRKLCSRGAPRVA